jgi:putative sugar O-methyltransferase
MGSRIAREVFRNRMKSLLPRLSPKASADHRVHTLKDNYNLSPEQYARCVAMVECIQRLYDDARPYAERKGLDPAVVLPGNEWAGIVPVSGIKFRTRYSDLNYLRLSAPFIGYHLSILDRMDRRRFPNDGGEQFAAKLGHEGIPDDIADILPKRMNMLERLIHFVPEYQKFIRNVPARYVATAPRMFGEIGIEVGGVVVNADVIMCQSRINGLLSSGVLDKLQSDIDRRGHARVLEVGPGYGALAYAIKSIFKDRLEYIAVDIPSSLYYCALYLGTLFDTRRSHLLEPGDTVPEHFDFLFVANYLTSEFVDAMGPIDLAMNTMSFPEMSTAQVRSYAELFRRLLRPDGVVFDENGVFLPHHVDSDEILASVFPYRKRVSSILAIDRNWQSVWSTRYVGEIFDRSDAMLGRPTD